MKKKTLHECESVLKIITIVSHLMWNQCSHAKTNAIFDRERKKETPTTTTGETNIIKNKNRNRFNENLAISYHVFKSYTIWLTALAGCLIETVKEWFVFYFCFSSFAFQAILLHSFRCCSGSRKCFLLLLLLFSSWMSKLCEHFFFRTPYLWIDNVECEIKKKSQKNCFIDRWWESMYVTILVM